MAFKYRGILGVPRPHDPQLGLLADKHQRDAWAERRQAEAMVRWRALFEAHGVEWGNETELLWKLAEAHVPGFRMQGRSGPPSVWNAVQKAELRIAIDDFVADKRHRGKSASISQACTELAKREPWKAMLRKSAKNPGAALRGHYNTADPRWVKVVLDARAWDALPAREKAQLGT